MQRGQTVYLPCQLSKSAFSGERVFRVILSDGLEYVVDADFKITWPDDNSTKSFKTAKVSADVFADVKDIAAVGSPLTCGVVSLEIADGEVYEVVDVTSA